MKYQKTKKSNDMKTIVYLLIVFSMLLFSCEKEAIIEEVFVHDTVYVSTIDTIVQYQIDSIVQIKIDTVIVVDTVIVEIDGKTDTVYMAYEIYIYDTIYVYDTVYIENPSVFGNFHCFEWEQWKNGSLQSSSGDKGWIFQISLNKYSQDLEHDGIFEYQYDIVDFGSDNSYFILSDGKIYYISFQGSVMILTRYSGDYTHKYYLSKL